MRFFLYLLLTIVTIALVGCSAEKQVSEWQFQTGDPLFSNPILDDGTLYFGSNDNTFYALDINSREARWTFPTTGPIQSEALLLQDAVFFTNTHSIFALTADTGEEIWRYSYQPDSVTTALDPWDYHHGQPAMAGEQIYFGLADGTLCGFEPTTGKLVDQFTTRDSSVIRCSPAVHEQVIYFGDWDGIVYAYDTELQDTIWTYSTYEERKYATFGQLNSRFEVYDSLLVFGARNPELQVLNRFTGDRVWNYINEDGGWISGEPLVHQDTLYIGGSDNHELFAFDVRTGSLLWKYEFLFNNFCKPLLHNDQLLLTTGDAGSVYRGDDGIGYLYSIERATGNMRNFLHLEANVYSSPVMDEMSIYVASEDGRLYAVDTYEFLNPTEDPKMRGYGAIQLTDPSSHTFTDSVAINYQINFETDLELTIYNLESTVVKHWNKQAVLPGSHTQIWHGNDDQGEAAPTGYYYYQFRTGQYYQSGYLNKTLP